MGLDELLAKLRVFAETHPDALVRIVDRGVDKHLAPSWIVFGEHGGQPEVRIIAKEIEEIDFDWSARTLDR